MNEATDNATLDDLRGWLKPLARLIPLENVIHDRESKNNEDGSEGWRFSFYTGRYAYRISVRTAGPQRRSYLGAIMSTRKPRAGEDHTRGRDLHDGRLTLGGWQNILSDIVAMEVVPLDIADVGMQRPTPEVGPVVDETPATVPDQEPARA